MNGCMDQLCAYRLCVRLCECAYVLHMRCMFVIHMLGTWLLFPMKRKIKVKLNCMQFVYIALRTSFNIVGYFFYFECVLKGV